jgi:chromosome segregation ATPase
MEGPLDEVVERLSKILREHHAQGASREGAIEALVERWTALISGDDGMREAQAQVERLLQRAHELKDENEDLHEQLSNANATLQQREHEVAKMRQDMDAARRKLDQDVHAFRAVLMEYEKQFGRVLSVSAAPAPTPHAQESSQDAVCPLLDNQMNLPRNCSHPLPFVYHVEYASSSATASLHALHHLKFVAEQEKARFSEQGTRLELLEQELKQSVERGEQLRAQQQKEGREAAMLRKALEEMQRQYNMASEQSTVLQSKLTRIGEGFQRILL